MSQIEAIYQNGVFKPLGKVDLPDNQRVLLSIQTDQPGDWKAWLESVQAIHRRIIEERGYYPDSTPDIREDRDRDE